MNNIDVYLTKDLYEASFLYASRAKLINLKKDGPYYWFIFENKSVCEKLTASYWNRESGLDPKSFADSLRSLKDKLFSKPR